MGKILTRVAAWLLLTIPLPSSASSVGFNIKADESAPWGSPAAQSALRELACLGVTNVSLVVFFWQPEPESTYITLGGDFDPAGLAAAVEQARELGLRVTVKPHVWVPDAWAGTVRPDPGASTEAWFDHYERGFMRIAEAAAAGGAQRLILATELDRMADEGRWERTAERVRTVFPAEISVVVSKPEALRDLPYVDSLGVSVYSASEPLETDPRFGLFRARDAIFRFKTGFEKPVWIAEIGYRSAYGALRSPWESPEQRAADPDMDVQLRAYQAAIEVFSGRVPEMHFWVWYTDPHAGGLADSDFIPRGKPAARWLSEWLLSQDPGRNRDPIDGRIDCDTLDPNP